MNKLAGSAEFVASEASKKTPAAIFMEPAATTAMKNPTLRSVRIPAMRAEIGAQKS